MSKLYAMTESDWRIWQRMKSRFQREPSLGIGSYESKKRPDWTPRLARATEGIASGSTGTFVLLDADETDSETDDDAEDLECLNRFGALLEDDIFHVGMIQGRWERMGSSGGAFDWDRAVVLQDITDETGGPCWIQEYSTSSFSPTFPVWTPDTLAGAQTFAAAEPLKVIQAIPWLPLETPIPAGACIILGNDHIQANSRWCIGGTCLAVV